MVDDDDKIRRNLVVVSSSILLSGYLDISLTDIWKRLMGDNTSITLPDPHALIICAFVVILYLALRYRFSGEGESYVQARDEALEQMHWKYVQDYVDTHSKKYLSTGQELLPHFDLANFRRALLDLNEDEKGPERTQVKFLTFHTFMIEKASSRWGGKASFNVSWATARGTLAGKLDSSSVDFFIESRLARASIFCASRVHALAYSKLAVTVLLPIVLALLASAHLGWKLYVLS